MYFQYFDYLKFGVVVGVHFNAMSFILFVSLSVESSMLSVIIFVSIFVSHKFQNFFQSAFLRFHLGSV